MVTELDQRDISQFLNDLFIDRRETKERVLRNIGALKIAVPWYYDETKRLDSGYLTRYEFWMRLTISGEPLVTIWREYLESDGNRNRSVLLYHFKFNTQFISGDDAEIKITLETGMIISPTTFTTCPGVKKTVDDHLDRLGWLVLQPEHIMKRGK